MLKFIGKKRTSFFIPDRMDNIKHDAKEEESMIVYDIKEYPIFGRVVDGKRSTWYHVLENWIWEE